MKAVKHLELLEGITLSSGAHNTRKAGLCVMEAAAYIAGRPHTDDPPCVSGVIAAFLRNWNDNLPDNATRDRLLKPLLPLILDTAGSPELERRRSLMALDWFVRVHVPAWFDLTPALKPSGDALRALDEINTLEAAQLAGPKVREAARQAAAAWAAIGAAAWAAIGDAARAAIAPTVSRLQGPAVELIKRMCALSEAEK